MTDVATTTAIPIPNVQTDLEQPAAAGVKPVAAGNPDGGKNPWEMGWNDLASTATKVVQSVGDLVKTAANPWEMDFGGKWDVQRDSDVPQPQPANTFQTVFNKLIGAESNGHHMDESGNLITSPKGAQGISQVMPATGGDPGYGVTPIQNNSPQEYLRFGADYLKAMVSNFGGDMTKGVAAYNYGAGAVQKLINSKGDQWQAYLPQETKNYVSKILGNGLALVTGSSNANASADFTDYLKTNQTTTQPNYDGKGTNTVQTNALGAHVVDIIQKDFPQHIDAINTKVLGQASAQGATAEYGGLAGDSIKLGNLQGSSVTWKDKNGNVTGSDEDVNMQPWKVNEALGITLHEIQHARMAGIGNFNDGVGKDYGNMLDDAAKAFFPSVVPNGPKNGDQLNEFLATATTIKEMQNKGYKPSGVMASATAALPGLEKKYPWLNQYIINYINPEAANSASNRHEVESARNK